ncbi:MAG: ABC transporter ATP-binding protein [Alteromonadaceae bacterium]|nr:ABC transporter ATP-binding protein [Alteromonadaceae bacterium]
MSDLLEIHQLSVKLQNKVILSDVELSLQAGDILGLVGPSGCGKTTLLNVIAGFIEPCSGQLTIGKEIKVSADNMIAPEHRNIGMIFQGYALFPHLTVEANIRFGIDKLSKQEQAKRIDPLLDLLKLGELTQRYPHELSGGQQQRVAIARALAPQPKLLLLDEPFSNIDARLRNELMIEIRQLLKHLNMTAIFVTHNKDEVFTFADKIAVMHQGNILQTGLPSAVCKQPGSWQVADFLQLGSWLPVVVQVLEQSNSLISAIGDFVLEKTPLKNDPIAEVHSDSIEIEEFIAGSNQNESLQLLIKPQFIELCKSDAPANVQVEHISITEQGYHYLLSSLSRDNCLKFDQLSFYTDVLLTIGQQIKIAIKSHDFVVFSNINP